MNTLGSWLIFSIWIYLSWRTIKVWKWQLQSIFLGSSTGLSLILNTWPHWDIIWRKKSRALLNHANQHKWNFVLVKTRIEDYRLSEPSLTKLNNPQEISKENGISWFLMLCLRLEPQSADVLLEGETTVCRLEDTSQVNGWPLSLTVRICTLHTLIYNHIEGNSFGSVSKYRSY